MVDRIVRHLDRLLLERDEQGVTVAERIAERLIEASLSGDSTAAKIILDALAGYDPCLAGDDDDEA